jgi:membrane-bound inhibitor of C-type lysozyme
VSVKCIITGQTSTVTPTTDASDLTSGTLSSDRLPTVPVTKGGTGATSLTSNAILAGNSTSAVKTISTASGALYATSSSGAASFGTLPVAQGGTGKTTNTSNAILTGNGTSAINNVATASGALYATSSNGAAKFGTLPLA